MVKKREFSLIIIGAGAAGLSAAWAAARLKAKVLLVEKEKPGGECLYTGCVPSKSFISAVRTNRTASFPEIKKHIRDIIKKIEPDDSFERYNRLGVATIKGEAVIKSRHEVIVNGRSYSTRSVIIATGAVPAIPEISGLDKQKYYTSSTIWGLDKKPGHLLIIGGGAAGLELGQTFARIGSKVTLLEAAGQILPAEDTETAGFLHEILQKQIAIHTGISELNVGKNNITFNHSSKTIRKNFTHLLLLAGKKAVVPSGIRLDTDKRGFIRTNSRLETGIPGIYAIGDVNGKKMLTNSASVQAWHAVFNALFRPLGLAPRLEHVPYAVFTSPEIARVGPPEKELDPDSIKKHVYPFTKLNRAVIENGEDGFIKIITDKKNRIKSVTICGQNASEMIGEYVLAINSGIKADKIARTSHIYPSMSEAVQFSAAGLTAMPPLTEKILRFFHSVFQK